MNKKIFEKCELLESGVNQAITILDLIDIEVHDAKTVLFSIQATQTVLSATLEESQKIAV